MDLSDADIRAVYPPVSRPEPGWPQYPDVPVRACLGTVLNEEREHRLDAERDLDVLEAGDQT